MPVIRFEEMPDSARVWVYGVSTELSEHARNRLLGSADEFLKSWTAHGSPLTSARNWSHDRFLTIAVDRERAGASGCSIDGLFRTLTGLERDLGVQIVTRGSVYFRGRDGRIKVASREEFSDLSAASEVDGDTEVFDTSVTSLGEWRARFSSRAVNSWHSALMSTAV